MNVKVFPVYIFLKNVIVSTFPFISCIFVYGVGKYSNLIFVFIVQGTHTLFFRGAVSNFHSQHQRRSSLFSKRLQCLMLVKGLTVAILTGLRWYLIAGLTGTSLMFSDVDVISCDLFFPLRMWVKGTCWTWLCDHLLSFEFLFVDPPWGSTSGGQLFT